MGLHVFPIPIPPPTSLSTRDFNPVISLLCCSCCSGFGIFHIDPCVLLTVSYLFLSIFLLSGTTKCSRFVLYYPCLSSILCSFLFKLIKFFWPHYATFRIFHSWLGIKPVLPTVETQSLNHWTIREVSHPCSFEWKMLTRIMIGVSVVLLLLGPLNRQN